MITKILHTKLTILLYLVGASFGYAQTGDPDTLQFPIDPTFDPTQTTNQSFDLGDPSGVNQTIVYDPITGTYIFTETIGNDLNYRNPSVMTFEEYIEYERQKSLQANWRDRIDEQTEESQPFQLPIKIDSKVFENFFGSDEIVITPQGNVELSFGVNSSRYDNPILPVRQRRITRFDFQQQIKLNLTGQIGTKLKINTSYDTQAAFNFDNISTLEYAGNEDQIVQKIALGNVSFNPPTALIPSSQTLFGASTQLRFGKTYVDVIAASQRGQRKEITIEGEAQQQQFEVTADNYEANRHYFINHYHRDHYDEAMQTLPIANTTINITRIEVWVTNRNATTENTRNIIAFADLGEALQENCEGDPGNFWIEQLPDNDANGLYAWASTNPLVRGFVSSVSALSSQVVQPGPFQQAIQYEKVENARKLSEQEFTYNAQLGFISLNLPLNNDEVLGVAYEYTYRGETYQVGELSTDGSTGQEALIMKMLRPTLLNPNTNTWDLMMKNVYSIGAYQLDQQGFRMDVMYNNPETSVLGPFLPAENFGLDPNTSALAEEQLVTLIEMDRINFNYQPFSDGVFDFVPLEFDGVERNRIVNAGTINTRNGRVYFSTIEPFGSTLKAKLLSEGVAPSIVDGVAFQELYDSTQIAAQLIPAKNRFSFSGQYQSSISSDIPLNVLNVPEGGVTVTAGGLQLIDGVDYTVDYNMGRVKILNTGVLESGTPINISVESNNVFGFQARSLIGSRISHRFSDRFNIGATWVRMMERPVTQKVDIGSEPYKNNILGADIQWSADVPFLTKMVDFLPGISTKAKSTIDFQGEFAHLIPGQPRVINRDGTSYIDDFEGAQSTIDLRSFTAWNLATIPQGQPDLFPEANTLDLSSRFKTSKIAWYVIDPYFYQTSEWTSNQNQISDSRMRLVQFQEIWPNQVNQYGTPTNVPVLDLAYYPLERGMYNYDTTNTLNSDGTFIDPQNRWGGIMRALTTNNFEQTNIEYIQFWLLDPYNDDAEAVNPGNHTGGDLYFNLGNISEDILPDSRKSFEHGLPTATTASTDNIDTTIWARVSTQQVIVNAFDADTESRENQDIGLDGWNNADEAIHYDNYVNWVQNNPTLDAAAKARMISDPSSDDYNYYRDDNYDAADLNILERYKQFNGMEGNSPTTEMSATLNGQGYPTLGSNSPDIEDINQDNNLSESESYFQYKISLRPQDMLVGQNYIISSQDYTVGTPTGNKVETWYQFRVPIVDYEKRINGITDFRSIRFMRMFLKEFDEEVVLRFARLEFIRGEWRRYAEDLTEPGDGVTIDPNLTTFNIGAVNIQENEQRSPVQYVIPPGIQQEIDPSQPIQRPLNEQSLMLEVCNLQDGDARAAFRNVQFDVRTYKRLKMFVHGEAVAGASTPLNDEDVTVFIRLGTDFTDNYYEYELPVNLTQPGASSDLEIWPESNNIDIEFEKLLDLKQERNAAVLSGTVGVANNVVYEAMLDNEERIIRVKGNPNLQGMKTIMIGVRNPGENSHDLDTWTEDGLEKCAVIWVNELRLTDFVDEGGSAATASMRVQFADFANLNMSANYSGINWGTVDSRVQERQRNQQFGFDLNANVQLGQFFGRKARVSLPFFYAYSLGIVNPEFDPFNPDIKLSEYTDLAERRRRSQLGQDFAERRSYNFSGVRKEMKAGATNRFWRVSNWTASYAFTENRLRDFNTKYDNTKTWTGNLAYNYSFNAKPIMPFRNNKLLKKSKWFKIIREMNFYPMPKNISFGNDIMRSYNEREIRNTIDTSFSFRPVFVKQFNWNRDYSLGWDLTKKLKFQFTASNRSLFTEGNGRVDRRTGEGWQEFTDSISRQLATFGTALDYTHNYSFSYSLPFDQIPATDWINGNVKYSGTYNWQRGPLNQSEIGNFGNTIQNSRNINFTAQANFTNLYNKIPWLKRVNSDGRSSRGGPRGTAVSPRRNATDGPTSNASPESSKLKKPEPPKPVEDMTEKEKRKWDRTLKRWERKVKREEKREKRGGKVHPVAGFAARAIMSVRNVSGTYNLTNGTVLPGYNQDVGILGFNPSFNSGLSGFIFGQQRYNIYGRETGYDIASTAATNGWLVQNEALNRQYTNTNNQTLNIRSTLQPIKDLSIELSLNRTYSTSQTEFFRWNPTLGTEGEFESQSPFETRTLTYSNVSFSSAFTTLGGDFESTVFDRLLANREEVSQLLGAQNPNSAQLTSGYYDGYGDTQQDVIIGAFMTSFSNRSVSDRNVNPIQNMPLPNWSVNYNGLKNFEFMKKKLKNFVIRHSYSNTVSVSGMQTNLNATYDNGGFATARDLNNNFIPGMVVQNIAVSERFSPLIGLDATWMIKTKGRPQGFITKFEYKKDRNATLSLNNNQVTEILGNEWVIGTGYKFTQVKLPFGKIEPNDLNVRIDISFRDNLTVIRKISEETNQATAGQRVVSIRSSADYNLNKYLVVSFYYDQTLNTPKVTTSFPTGNLSTGLRLRFNLAGVQ